MQPKDKNILFDDDGWSQQGRPVVLSELYDLLARAVRVVVKDSPFRDAPTLFESTKKEDLVDIQESLILEEPKEWSHCMCMGGPVLYLYDSGGELVEVTNHHGFSIRCSLWTGNLFLSDTEKWLSWFDRRGMYGPRQQVEAAQK